MNELIALGGTAPDTALPWLENMVYFMGLLVVIFGLVGASCKIKKNFREETDRKIEEEKDKAVKETESAMAFKALKETVMEMRDDVRRMAIKFEVLDDHGKMINKIAESTNAAHKRLDEHKEKEHGISEGGKSWKS